MVVSAFAYASLRSNRLEDWADYGGKFLGLELVERTPSALSFRRDERKQRIFVQSGDRHAFGFKVDASAALDALGGRLDRRRSWSSACPRPTSRCARCATPSAWRTRPATGLKPFMTRRWRRRRSHRGGRFPASALARSEMGHVVFPVERAQNLLWLRVFYVARALGMLF
jgi:hypothetical protein